MCNTVLQYSRCMQYNTASIMLCSAHFVQPIDCVNRQNIPYSGNISRVKTFANYCKVGSSRMKFFAKCGIQPFCGYGSEDFSRLKLSRIATKPRNRFTRERYGNCTRNEVVVTSQECSQGDRYRSTMHNRVSSHHYLLSGKMQVQEFAGERTALIRRGYNVRLPSSCYVRTNHFIKSSQRFVKYGGRLCRFWHFPFMRVFFVLHFLLVLPCGVVWVYACIACLLTILWLLFLLQHVYVLLFTLPAVMKQPVVSNETQGRLNDFYELSGGSQGEECFMKHCSLNPSTCYMCMHCMTTIMIMSVTTAVQPLLCSFPHSYFHMSRFNFLHCDYFHSLCMHMNEVVFTLLYRTFSLELQKGLEDEQQLANH